MKKFVKNIALFSLLVSLLYIILMIIPSSQSIHQNDYLQAIVDKHHRVDSITQPKLIFAGGSNLSFGLNSEEIEEEFQVPVVNMGLHAGLGLEFVINELKSVVDKGDVVLISPEYLLKKYGNYELKNRVVDYLPKAKDYFSKDWFTEISLNAKRTRKKIKYMDISYEDTPSSVTDNPIYARKSFNKYGDVVGHLDKPIKVELKDQRTLQYRAWEGIDMFNDLKQFADQKGVKLFFLFPVYPASEFNKNKQVIQQYESDIRAGFHIPVINDTEDMVLNDSLFYDTIYHLNKQGRQERTRRMIQTIQNSPNVVKAIANLKR